MRRRRAPGGSLTIRLSLALAAGLSLAGIAAQARAADSVSFSLEDPVRTVTAAGDTLAFKAVIAAPAGNIGSPNLNGLSITISGVNSFTIDYGAFFDDTPLFLDPGDSYAGPLFSILVPAGSVAQRYLGFANLQGGPAPDSQDTLATATFAITVQAAPAVPEAATWGMMMLGLGVAGAALRGRRKFTANVAYAG